MIEFICMALDFSVYAALAFLVIAGVFGLVFAAILFLLHMVTK